MNGTPVEVGEGVLRATFELPLGIDHVHCYFLRGTRGWTLVDTALALPGIRERWRALLGELDAPVERIVVTHFHPDHVGGAALVAELTGAPVLQGTLDYSQCVRVWGPQRSPAQLARFMRRHGMPERELETLLVESNSVAEIVRFESDPEPLEPGDRVDGWQVLHLPGHADGHLCLLRDGVLIAGDALLLDISPAVGLYPESRPDPLADFLASLATIARLDPDVAFAGHGRRIDRPAARARELAAHHGERLAAVRTALGNGPQDAYAVSWSLFPSELPRAQRRFAVAESLAHLERLVAEGSVKRLEDELPVRYADASEGDELAQPRLELPPGA